VVHPFDWVNGGDYSAQSTRYEIPRLTRFWELLWIHSTLGFYGTAQNTME